MAMPKWLRKLIDILIIIFERSAANTGAIAEHTARLEKLEALAGANSEGDAALAKRVEELQASENSEDDDILAALEAFKTGDEEEETPAA